MGAGMEVAGKGRFAGLDPELVPQSDSPVVMLLDPSIAQDMDSVYASLMASEKLSAKPGS